MNLVNGENVLMKVSNNKHFGLTPTKRTPGDFMAHFSDAVKNSIENVNNLQVHSDKLSVQMVRKPDSVNVHDVMIAAQKAQLSLDYTKTIIQKAVQAYQSIINLR